MTPPPSTPTAKTSEHVAGRHLGLRLGVIGSGNMAEALIKGLLGAGVFQVPEVTASDVRASRLEELKRTFGIRTTQDNREVARASDVILLSVKPQIMAAVLGELAGSLAPEALVVSIAAGVPIAAMERALGQKARVIRVMPNTPALVGAGASALCAGRFAGERDVEVARSMLESVGTCVVLDDESLLDAVTGLSGSGPAYMFLIIEALADAGVKVGLPRYHAQALAAQTVLGSAKLLLDTGEHPGQLKDMVTSPGGTAIAGLAALEQGGLRTTLINAVEAATRRARELGEEMARKAASAAKDPTEPGA
jgi:pyrroline-5-carboxylate reductase